MTNREEQMPKEETVIHLYPHFFGEAERTLVESEGLKASTFRYLSGVCGLRLVNQVG